MRPDPDPLPGAVLRNAARPRLTLAVALALSAALLLPAGTDVSAAAPTASDISRGGADPGDLARQVVIRRTRYGVPHIRAESLRAMGFGLAWAMTEDYGVRLPRELLEDRGTLSRHFGRDSLDDDAFRNRRAWHRAVATYSRLSSDTRAVLEGFAAGVNRYVQTHPGEFPAWMPADFSGYDVHARSIGLPDSESVETFLERLRARRDSAPPGPRAPLAPPVSSRSTPTEARDRRRGFGPDDTNRPGSNAWALGPDRTASGAPILLRNPHLSWDAGYYEAHVTVPGEVNFYGDFRIGGPFGIIGGFNDHLGWSTTNNYPDLDQVYALRVDPGEPDHVLLDGESIPLRRQEVTVEFRNGPGLASETRTYWSTPLGPVIHRADGRVYVTRSARDGRFRRGEQFLRMMQADSLAEWKRAMRIRGRTKSNFTYADDRGNIYYVWNARMPRLPHPSAGDTAAVEAPSTDRVWTRLVPYDSLPQLRNPEGGYLHNENDPFHYTNLEEVFAPGDFPPHYPDPALGLRSQHSLQLITGEERLRLDGVVERKHSTRMLLADRVKPDLLEALRSAAPSGDLADGLRVLEGWNNRAGRESRGAVLFKTWWEHYLESADSAEESPASAGFEAEPRDLFAEPWSPDRPTGTPRGLGDPDRAVAAFRSAVDTVLQRWDRLDVAWGHVHRVRRGEVDAPVSGCSGSLGCFRVLWYDRADDGRLVADGGDGWVFAVRFSDPPRAYSVLAYGQSSRPDSPHFDDQARMFAEGRMKPVAFTEDQIREELVRRYRPGLGSVDGER